MKKLFFVVLIIFLVVTGVVYGEGAKVSNLISQTIETDNEFEIQGTITSVNDSSFLIRGELVAVSSEDMSRYKTNEIVKMGNFVRVEGKIENNIMVAEEITLLEKNFQEVPILSEEVKSQTLLENIIDAIKELFN